jgi:hypothetical protein
MAELTTPAAASFETLNNILIGFYRAGAFENACSNEEVNSRTGISVDVISRNNGFFKELQILSREGAKHKLTEAGRDYAKYLHYGQLNDAKKVLARLMSAWEPIAKLLDTVELKGPLAREELVSQVAMRAEVSTDNPRYSTGVSALIDLLLFAGLIAESAEGLERVKQPAEDQTVVAPIVEKLVRTGPQEFVAQVPVARPEAAIELRVTLAIDAETNPEQVAKIIRAIRLALREELNDTRGQ